MIVPLGTRLRTASKQLDEGNTLRNRQRIPAGAVEARERHRDEAMNAKQSEMASQLDAQLHGIDAVSGDSKRGVTKNRFDGDCRCRQVAEDVGAPGDTLFGLEIDEHERRSVHPPRARAERTLHRHAHRRRAD